MGVLSASFCSAIIFAKISKYQSIAHVMFSEHVVIRFGQELMQNHEFESTNDVFSHLPGVSDDGQSCKSGKSGKSGLSSNRHKGKMLDRRSCSQIDVRYPCPILEFRVVNLLHNEKGGEIMNCKLNVVASTLKEVTKRDKDMGSNFFDLPSKQVVKGMKLVQSVAAKSAKKVTTSGELMKRSSLIQKVNRSITDFASSYNQFTLDASDNNDAEGRPFKEGEDPNGEYYVNVDNPFPKNEKSAELEKLADEDITSISNSGHDNRRDVLTRSQSIFVDEEPGEGNETSNSRRVFSKVEIETDSHPFFKRIWNIRHILNENSPLLTEDARNVIRLNNGLWPASLCNPDVIRGCLEMSQLIVSLSGTAVVSGSSVYKLHVYEADFVQIGRTFENPLARDPDGKLTVDMHLVHSTKPQFEETFSDR